MLFLDGNIDNRRRINLPLIENRHIRLEADTLDAETAGAQSKLYVMNERPTFYAVIPAHVRYSTVSAHAKLLYGELTALTEKEGFCWASNGYLAKLYDAGSRSVSRWVAELVHAGFIVVEPAVNQHGQRKVYIADCASPNLAGQKWQAKNGEQNNTSKKTIQEKRERAQSLEAFLEKNDPRPWFMWSEDHLKWTRERCRVVFATFRDYWRAKAGKDALKADWEATWRNWCRREGSFEKQKPLGKGEIRVKEGTPEEALQGQRNAEFMRLRKLNENADKSDQQVWEMVG